MAVDGQIVVAISEPIIDETLRELQEKFGRSGEQLLEVETWIRSFTRLSTPTQRVDLNTEDPPENRILECAEASRSEYIVSGDKDLHRLGHYGSGRYDLGGYRKEHYGDYRQ
jgi:predicted nucleic acid-binding protein